MSDKSIDCRAAAALCLATVTKGFSLNQQIPLFEQRVKERDRSLFRQLCYGVLRFYPRLMGVSHQLLQKSLKPKDADVLMLILLGGYQLTDTRVPEHAAVSATVAATRNLKKPWAKALVNGVLRQWQRRMDELTNQLTPAQKLAHPDWLHQHICSAWGDLAEAIEQQNNLHPPMCLRVNQRHVSRDEYLEQLSQAGINAQGCEFAATGVRLEQPMSVDELPGFKEGRVSVQDEAAQLAASLLSLAQGQRVLDACSAPGGKTCHLLEAEPNLDEVVALDVDEERIKKVSQNLSRLGLTATISVGDAAQPDSWWDGNRFDRILLDAPCSGTGVIRRNPDIKLHRQAHDIKQLSQLQLHMLNALWPTLNPGGLLLYSTCSIIPEENEKVIALFCQSEQTAQHQPIDAAWGIPRPFGRQLFPQENGHDGFYYALLVKKSLNK
jgi:16S rRNA (cytosine967-C5)-methyltransferase